MVCYLPDQWSSEPMTACLNASVHGPLLLTWINSLILVGISNYTHHEVWDEMTSPFTNFNSWSLGMGNNFIPFTGCMIVSEEPIKSRDSSQSILVKETPGIKAFILDWQIVYIIFKLIRKIRKANKWCYELPNKKYTCTICISTAINFPDQDATYTQ